MEFKSFIRVVSLCVVIGHLVGCSTSRTLPAPHQSQPIAINVTKDELSGWSDLPPGVYRVPDSQVIISGHQSSAILGILFGPLGIAVQSSIDSSRGESATQDASAILKMSLTDEATNTISEYLSDKKFDNDYFLGNNSDSSPQLNVRTAVVLTFINDVDVKPYVLLQTDLMESGTKKSVWKSRYISSSAISKPLTGDDSWLSDNGEGLKENLSVNLKKAIGIMLSDISSPFTRNEDELTMVQAYYPYVRKKFQTVGYKLSEDDESIAYIPLVGDAVVFSGVNLMDKSAITFRAAQSDDASFKFVE